MMKDEWLVGVWRRTKARALKQNYTDAAPSAEHGVYQRCLGLPNLEISIGKFHPVVPVFPYRKLRRSVEAKKANQTSNWHLQKLNCDKPVNAQNLKTIFTSATR